jgi:quinolinate synthase
LGIIDQILTLKKSKEVTILAHFYQSLEIQKIADYIGDSLGLAKIAKNNIETPYIVFAGVAFMAETASILNQAKTVLIPDQDAGCPLSDYLNPEIIAKFRQEYPYAPLVVYVNTTAETKAFADVCCTSSNAETVVKKIAAEHKTNTILFGPDKNLAAYVAQQTNFKIITIPGDGNCKFHNAFTITDVENSKKLHPNSPVLIHPESPMEVLKLADYVGSTAGIESYVESHESSEGFIIGTEVGMLAYLQQKFSQKTFYPMSEKCLCEEMKKITLEKILAVLEAIGTAEEKKYEIKVPLAIAKKAIISIDKMMDFS